MNNLISKDVTMSSREIADLTGKRHPDVKRDIEKMLKALDIDVSKFARTYSDNQNRKQTEYHLTKELTETLITGYSVKLRHAIVKRWNELEQKQQWQIPQTLPEALQLAADLAKKIEEDKPKIEVYERLADRKGDVSTTVIAKQLGTTSIKLNRWLREIGAKWLNSDLPKAGFMDWFNVVSDVKNGHEFTQCLVTPHGQIEIAKRWEAK